MKRKDLSRREFNKLSLAAFGGALTGALVGGCENGKKDAGDGKANLHACRGLNECKGQGDGGENTCAGVGSCSTVAAHECAKLNECKGLGGCQGEATTNECKGKGGCGVPLKDDAWKGARTAFEARMKKDGKTVGDAPPKA
ncbi:MAG: hypothetical protein O7J95_15710 [Planctomycetota bacterium]|nr:hypothetical protein [Planctomycetota bacterium]